VKFHIWPAFYQTAWFWGIIIIGILGAGFYLIRSRFRRQQAINTKIIDLEQQALKAQMNPHFIFNCLTAIQHFVNKEDVYSANMYLSNFAKLIRKTLDLSGEQYITLDKEVAYLENYIQLEKMRFQEQFNYKIRVDENIDVFSVQIPPMLLQPIIENAIRHGLRYKDNNEGMLNIEFASRADSIICKITDNGIGIRKSKELKSTTHVEYQSKGMKLTESRIAAINMISEKKISMEIIDQYDTMGMAVGTIVILIFMQ
jgi:LytS/YehU family sensor histidine kinase